MKDPHPEHWDRHVPAATGPQYKARQVDEDDVYTHQVYEPSGRGYLGPNMTPAQAEIFAFGLNGISRGFKLAWVKDDVPGLVDVYNGPTEGVRA